MLGGFRSRPDATTRAALDADVLVAARSASAVLGGVYLALAVTKPWVTTPAWGKLTGPLTGVLAGTDLVLAVLFLALHVWLRRAPPPVDAANLIVLGAISALTLETSLHVLVLEKHILSIGYVLLAMGAALFLSSTAAFGTGLGVILLAWAVSASLTPETRFVTHEDMAIYAGITIAVATLLHYQRMTTLVRVHESERRYRLIAESAPDLLYRVRLAPGPTLEYVSPSIAPMLGLPPDAVPRDAPSLFAHVHPDDRGALRRALESGSREPYLVRWTRADGDVVWLEHRDVDLEDAAGARLAVEGIARDVTERKRVEAELRASRDSLERLAQELRDANQELEAFSYSTSHDLKAPLRAIDVHSSILLEDHADRLGPEERSRIERVRREAQRLTQLVNDLLRLSRVGRESLERETVDVTRAARATFDALRLVAPERRVSTRVQDGLRAEADPALVSVLLENLLGNAWKFTAKTPDASIEVGAEPGTDPPVFFVRDNGAGFDPAQASRLFQPFQRLHASSEFEGSGVGLATVQRIVHRHGGRVSAQGEPGRGATFHFTLAPPRAGGRRDEEA